jgi:hypothetical protein
VDVDLEFASFIDGRVEKGQKALNMPLIWRN